MNSAKTDVPQVPMGTVPPGVGASSGEGRAGTVQAASLDAIPIYLTEVFDGRSCDIFDGRQLGAGRGFKRVIRPLRSLRGSPACGSMT